MIHRCLPLALIAAGCAAFFAFGLHGWITIEQFAQHRVELGNLVARHPLAAVLVYIVAYVVITAFSVPGASALTVFGGFLFGAAMTTAATVFGATLGATVLFLAARTALGESLRARAGPWARRLETGFRRDAFNYLLTLRLIPLFPFFAINLVSAVLGVGLRTFVITTFLGIIPGTFVFASIGAGLGDLIAAEGPFDPADLLAPEIVVGLVGLGLLALAPVVYRRLRRPPPHDPAQGSSPPNP